MQHNRAEHDNTTSLSDRRMILHVSINVAGIRHWFGLLYKVVSSEVFVFTNLLITVTFGNFLKAIL